MQLVVSKERPDLAEQAEQTFRARWPEFIFHDPVNAAHIDRVGQYFWSWNLWMLDKGRVVAGGWGGPCNGTAAWPICPTVTTAR